MNVQCAGALTKLKRGGTPCTSRGVRPVSPQVAAAGLDRVHEGGPDVWGQVHHAIDHEWACTVEDVVRRRTTLAIRGLAGPDVRDAIGATLARRGVFQSVDGRWSRR